MELKFSEQFSIKLNRQLHYIASDKPSAARKFKTELFRELKKLPEHPYLCRKSIYFEHKLFRELIFKGYTIIYKIEPKREFILVFSILKHQSKP